jgi:hypothetical protein
MLIGALGRGNCADRLAFGPDPEPLPGIGNGIGMLFIFDRTSTPESNDRFMRRRATTIATR